jgi:peptidoglycan/xylan/chitin deacetylase (PgdA/CDA1 family)
MVVMRQRTITRLALAGLALLAMVTPGSGQSGPGVPSALAASSAVGASPQVSVEQTGEAVAGAGLIVGSTRRRILHFTFDDGPDPDPQLTPRLLDALDRVRAKATFFFSTSRFASKEKRNAQAAELAREVARRGHQIGSHGFDHVRMSRLRAPQLATQMASSERAFEQVFGRRTFLFRPPFGSRNAILDGMLSQGRYATVLWNIGMADWVERPPEAIAQTFWRVLERNETRDGDRGGVILLHDTHAWSVTAFELITAELGRRNCELLARGEELFDLVDSLAPWVTPLSDAAYAERQARRVAEARAHCGAPRTSKAR